MDAEDQAIKVARGKRLRQVRNILNMTIIEFAQICSVGESTIRLWEQAQGNGLSGKGAHRVSSSVLKYNLFCDANWLLHGDGNAPSRLNLQQRSKKHWQFSPALISEDISLIKKEMDLFLLNSEKAIIHSIQDDAMQPYFFLGDYVGGYKTENEIAQFVGQIMIIHSDTYPTMIREISKINNDGTFRVGCVNNRSSVDEAVIDNLAIKSAAPICRIWRTPQLLAY